MRIGFDAKRLFNNYTGLGNYARTLVQNLSQSHNKNDYFLYATHSNKNIHTNYFYEKRKINLIFSNSFFKFLWRSFGIVNQLKKDKIDIYIGLTNEIPFGINKSGIASVVVIHDLIFKIYPKTYPFIDRLIYDFKFKYACKNSTKIIAISEQTKNDIIKYYNISEDKIEVIYQSCHSYFFEENKLEKTILDQYNIPEKYNLYVGSVNKRKNLISIIKAYSLLKGENLIPLVIIGNGKKYKEECINLIKKLKLDHYFIWVNNLQNIDHLHLTYLNANIFIYPSLYEGFGIPIIESLLSKTPVITSQTSSLPEASGGHALLINPEKPTEIVKAIETLNSNKELRIKLINAGYKYCINNFNSNIISDKLNSFLNKI